MSRAPLSPFTRQRVAQLAEHALRDAGVVGELPTPMEAIHAAAGVEEVLDMSDLPKEIAARKPRFWKRILGATWFSERTVFIDRSEPNVRQRFTDGHEATHAICPWHEPALRLLLDSEQTLMGRSNSPIEIEADYGSSYLIFQGGRFHRKALRDQVSLRTPIGMAEDYAASRHAAAHYYVEEHPDAVALVVAGRYPRANGTVPVWHSIESRRFLRQFGRFEDHLPNGALSIVEGDTGPLADIVNEARTALDPPSKNVGLTDKGGSQRLFVAEAFFNGYCYFVFVADEKARRLGRRARLAS